MATKMSRLIGIAVLFAGCRSGVISAQAAGSGPTDPEIVGIVVTANQIDIDHAKLALSKSKNKEVRDFARQMVTDHSALQKSVSDLGAKLHVTPAESEISSNLKTQAERTTQKLNALSGSEFDKAYIDNEVAYHQAVIHAVSTVLIPDAQNAELKSALQGAAPLFQGHLKHAERVQADLQGAHMSSGTGGH
jgi:putative membrane protein